MLVGVSVGVVYCIKNMAAEKSKLKIARVYADSSGESHFSSFEIGMINNGECK